MRRLTGIATLLFLVLMLPLAHACAAASRGAKAQHDCCQQDDVAVQCGQMSSNLCCAMQAPADTTPYPVHSVSPLMLPAATVAVVYSDRVNSTKSISLARHLPARHPPPGLLIASTIVLRI
jgi:hypothetical protein